MGLAVQLMPFFSPFSFWLKEKKNVFLLFSCYDWDSRQSQNKAADAYSTIQKDKPCFLPRWYPQSWLLALFWGCLYIPRSSRRLSQTWIYVLAVRVSTGNYTSGVSLWSHLIWARELISLHLSFSACKADNNAGTTQRAWIEVLASPWLRRLKRYRGFSFYPRQSKMPLSDWSSLYLLNCQQPMTAPGIRWVTSQDLLPAAALSHGRPC